MRQQHAQACEVLEDQAEAIPGGEMSKAFNIIAGLAAGVLIVKIYRDTGLEGLAMMVLLSALIFFITSEE